MYSLFFDGGKFGAPVTFSATSLGYARAVAVADLNRDGLGDLVYSGGYGLYAFIGDGKGGYSGRFSFPLTVDYDVAVGDLDADGWPDVVAFADRAVFAAINTSR